MKKRFSRLWQEIAKVLKWILRNQSLLRLVLKVGYYIFKLLERIEK